MCNQRNIISNTCALLPCFRIHNWISKMVTLECSVIKKKKKYVIINIRILSNKKHLSYDIVVSPCTCIELISQLLITNTVQSQFWEKELRNDLGLNQGIIHRLIIVSTLIAFLLVLKTRDKLQYKHTFRLMSD